LIGRKPLNLIVGWCGRFLFFVVPRQFSQVVGEWPENQILIPDWIYFHCPGTTLAQEGKDYFTSYNFQALMILFLFRSSLSLMNLEAGVLNQQTSSGLQAHNQLHLAIQQESPTLASTSPTQKACFYLFLCVLGKFGIIGCGYHHHHHHQVATAVPPKASIFTALGSQPKSPRRVAS